MEFVYDGLGAPLGTGAYPTSADEEAIREALPAALRTLFTVSVHTGLRLSEQLGLTWGDVDFLTPGDHRGAVQVGLLPTGARPGRQVEPLGHGRCRPAQRPGPRWLAHAGDGAALQPPGPDAAAGGRGAPGPVDQSRCGTAEPVWNGPESVPMRLCRRLVYRKYLPRL